jgi:hypothetical protein
MNISERIKEIGETFVTDFSEISSNYQNMDICKDLNFQNSEINMYTVKLWYL